MEDVAYHNEIHMSLHNHLYFQFMMLFQCSRCPFKSSRSNAVAHFIIKHAPTDQVPYRCNNCNYKSVSLGKWRRHIRKEDLTKHVCITSTTPYIIGESDIIDITTSTQNKLITCTFCTSNNSDDTTMEDTTTREEEVIVEVEEVVVMVDLKDEKIMELESEIEFIKEKHIKEIEDIKQSHKFECLRFGDFIERIEKKKKDLQKEVDKLTSILKKEKEETEQKNLKSVVHVMPKKHENSRRRLF